MRRFQLIHLRETYDMTQKDVVKHLKETCDVTITESYYGMIEQGVRTPSLKIAVAISKVFNTNLEYIFFNNEHNELLCNEVD